MLDVKQPMETGGPELKWQVYVILCTDDTLYTGITTDIERRMRQHADGSGAKYFRGRLPKQLLYLEGGHDRSSASKRELSIKGMKRQEKKLLVTSEDNVAYRCVEQPPMLAVLSYSDILEESSDQEPLQGDGKYVNMC